MRRDFNHPFVILWSLGNEGGVGPNIEAMYNKVRELDAMRPPTGLPKRRRKLNLRDSPPNPLSFRSNLFASSSEASLKKEGGAGREY